MTDRNIQAGRAMRLAIMIYPDPDSENVLLRKVVEYKSPEYQELVAQGWKIRNVVSRSNMRCITSMSHFWSPGRIMRSG